MVRDFPKLYMDYGRVGCFMASDITFLLRKI